MVKGSPARKNLFTNSIYAFSFVVRMALNWWTTMDPEQVMHVQCMGHYYGTKGWAIIVFMIHSIGEIIPLSLLFWVQSLNLEKIKSNSHESLRDTTTTEMNRTTLGGSEVDNRLSTFKNPAEEDSIVEPMHYIGNGNMQ